jgi:hypothetical protein
MIKNTSYKVQVDVDSDEIREAYKIEEGAYVTTSTGVYTVWNGEWRKIYPQGGAYSGLGWARYDDTVYTSTNKLSLAADTLTTVPNNAGNVVRSHTGFDYYDSSTQKILGENVNDTYLFTIAFKAQAPNANQTFLEYNLVGSGQIARVSGTLAFPKGNDIEHQESMVMQYYTDADFVADGVEFKITSVGGTSKVWDIIYFIQKTQNYA